MPSQLWRVVLAQLDAAGAEAAVVALDGALEALSAFEASPDGLWQVEGLATELPDGVQLETRLALAWAGRNETPPELSVERIPIRDWVSENQAGFPPLLVGRYFIYGTHFAGRVPPGRIGLLIDAATAFGTGEHATTRGCLMALDGLAHRGRRRRVLDMGTGTGVLAIAAAKTWRLPIVARDIDPESVRVARHNAIRNGVGDLIEARCTAGYRDRGLWFKAPYDLVFANILARPLMVMARDLGSALAPDGVAVLSGLLARQAPAVLAAHRRLGFRLRHRIAVDGWHTLVLDRRGPFAPASSFLSSSERP